MYLKNVFCGPSAAQQGSIVYIHGVEYSRRRGREGKLDHGVENGLSVDKSAVTLVRQRHLGKVQLHIALDGL